MGAAGGRRRGDDEILTAAAAVSVVRIPVAAASVPVISGALGGRRIIYPRSTWPVSVA